MRGNLCTRTNCRTALVIGTNGNGVTVATCPPCERNRAGFCRDCPARLKRHPRTGFGNQMRCQRCSLRLKATRAKNRYRQDPEHYRRIKRRSDQSISAEAREKRRLRKLRWHQEHPQKPDALMRLYKREYCRQYYSDPKKVQHRRDQRRLRLVNNPDLRERVNEYQRRRRLDPAIRARNAEYQRQLRAQKRATAA